MAPNIFEIVRDIRQMRLGRNPFVMITMMVTPEKDVHTKKAILVGCDDVMIKPVSPGRLLERVSHFTFNRLLAVHRHHRLPGTGAPPPNRATLGDQTAYCRQFAARQGRRARRSARPNSAGPWKAA